MPNIYLVHEDKSITKTQRSNIFQGDYNSDSLIFLIPQILNDVNIISSNAYFVCEGFSEFKLSRKKDLYKGYFVYEMDVISALTEHVGKKFFYISIVCANLKITTSESFFEVKERGA